MSRGRLANDELHCAVNNKIPTVSQSVPAAPSVTGRRVAENMASKSPRRLSVAFQDEHIPQDLWCSYCSKPYTEPKLLACLHTFCKTCVEPLLGPNANTVGCPQCQTETPLSSDNASYLLPNVLIRKKLDDLEKLFQEQKATICGGCDNGSSTASYRCVECDEFLCEDCLRAHRRVKFTRDHNIQGLRDLAETQRLSDEQKASQVECFTHGGEIYDRFCESCGDLTCQQCRSDSHQGHELLSLSEAVKACTPEISSLLEVARQNIPELQKSVYDIIKRYARLQNQIDDVTWEIRKTSRRLIQAVKDREHELLKELNDYKDRKGATLISEKEHIERTLVGSIDGCDFTEEILSTTEAQEAMVLLTKNLVCDRLRRLNAPESREELQKSKVSFEVNEEPVLHAIRTAFGSVQIHNAPPKEASAALSATFDGPTKSADTAMESTGEVDKGNPNSAESESYEAVGFGDETKDGPNSTGEMQPSQSDPLHVLGQQETIGQNKEQKASKGRRFSLPLSPRKQPVVETVTKPVTTSLVVSTTDSRGKPRDVEVQLESPDNSVISAQIMDNKNGTYTVFYCPRTPGDHNLYVSVGGKNIKHGSRVLNMYGSFQNMKGEELTLVCKALCLLRWQITPGLVKMKGDKKVANKKMNFQDPGKSAQSTESAA